MRPFRDQSIRRKLSAMLILVVSIVLLVQLVFRFVLAVSSTRESMAREYTMLANVLAASSDATLSEDLSVQSILEVLAAEPTVELGCIYDRTGRVVAQYRAKDSTETSIPKPKPDEARFADDGYLEIFQAVKFEDVFVGTVFLRVRPDEIQKANQRTLLVTIVGFAAGIVIAMALSFLLHRVLTKPLLQLSEAMQAVTRDRNYAIRVEKPGNDEVGILCDGFNGMLAELESHTTRLEDLVRERTESLQDKEQRMRAILDGAVDAVITIDEHGVIESANPSTERLFGYPVSELAGQNVKMLMPDPFRSEHDGYLQRYLAMGERHVIGIGREVLGKRRDGTTFHADLTVSEVHLNDRRMFTGFVHNISDRKRVEDELKRSNTELAQFAYISSHDLQEPLRKIQAFGDMLVNQYRDVLGDEGRDYLLRMQGAAKRMQGLINDLLNYSRITTKAQPFVPVNLSDVAHHVLIDLETRIQQTGGRIETDPLPTIDADPTQMRQLLQNLIGNALKYHRADEPPVVKVQSRLLKPGDRAFPSQGPPIQFCEITVEDNGIGFEQKYVDRIFAPFERLHGRGEYEGTGMGLAICRKIVERHGGTITARSIPHQGSTFVVTIPLRQPQGARKDEPV